MNGATAPKISLSPREVEKLFRLTYQIVDFSEDVLEKQQLYKKEFLRGLKRSVSDAKIGKLTKIESLIDLF